MIILKSGLTIKNRNFSIVLSHSKPSRILISVPHDGFIADDFSGLFQERKHGRRSRDLYVWPIANGVVRQGLHFGTRIDAIRFLMARVYIDANRELFGEPNLDTDTYGQTALDDQRLVGVYRHYYREIRRRLDHSIEAFGADKILLIDLHGFGKQPEIAPPEGYDLIIGTANRTTIRHGEVDRAFADFMRSRNYRVFLPGKKAVSSTGDPYSAGHITRWHAQCFGINAIQIEISPIFRKRENKEEGERFSADIAEFLSGQYR